MGYSVNPELVEQRRTLLKPLAEGKTTRWDCDPDPVETRRFVYALREALAIAAMYPLRFPELAVAAENFAIVIAGPGVVEARVKRGKTEASVSSSVATHGLEPQGKPVPEVGLMKAYEIVNSWYAHLPSSDPLHFTQTWLPFEELIELHKFCKANTPSLMMLVDEDQGLLTVSLFDTTVTEFAWNPPKPKKEEKEVFDFDKPNA